MKTSTLWLWVAFGLIVTLVVASILIQSWAHLPTTPSEPEYCRLVFGPKADLRLLVCKQKGMVSIDRDGKRVFSGSELECRKFSLTDPQNHATYSIADVRQYTRHRLLIIIQIKDSTEWLERCDIEMASDAREAKEAHFDGPLTVAAVTSRSSPYLWKHSDGEMTTLYVAIRTIGGDKGCPVSVARLPSGVHPVVDIEFPAKQEGTPPIKCRYPLAEPC